LRKLRIGRFLLGFRLLDDLGGLLLDLGPAAAQRLHQNRFDDQADVGLAGVMRSQLRPFIGVEAALEKGTEDGGLDTGPIQHRRESEHGQIVSGQVVGFVVGE
jgi:hypothetical protein